MEGNITALEVAQGFKSFCSFLNFTFKWYSLESLGSSLPCWASVSEVKKLSLTCSWSKQGSPSWGCTELSGVFQSSREGGCSCVHSWCHRFLITHVNPQVTFRCYSCPSSTLHTTAPRIGHVQEMIRQKCKESQLFFPPIPIWFNLNTLHNSISMKVRKQAGLLPRRQIKIWKN